MVKKLIKHEFIAYSRSLLPIELALIGIAVVLRFIQFFENSSTGYAILFGSAVFAFVAAIIVCLVMTFIVSIQRYYKNLFKAEGYLTFTLPVSNHQLILSKLFSAVSVTIITFVNIFVSICVATAGEVCVEIFKAMGYLIKKYIDLVGVNGVFYVIEIIILCIVAFAAEYLLFYACITLGQTAKKNRVAAAVGIYFGYYYATQILATVATIIFSTTEWLQNIAEAIVPFVVDHPYAFAHIALILMILVIALVGALYYLVAYKVMRKKLNLE